MILAVTACAQDAQPDMSSEACTTDANCSAGVCARTQECLPPAAVQKVQVLWTVGRRAPDASSCANGPDVWIEFDTELDQPATGDGVTFGPMPCVLGKFTVDKLPRRFLIAGVRNRETGMWVPLDATGTAMIDLAF